MLVKVSRSYEVNAVLFQSFLFAQASFNVKPYISPAERHIESILLKQRRQLINSGVDCKDIKIRMNQLFWGKLLVWEVIYSSFRPATSETQENDYSVNINDTHEVSSPPVHE